MTWSNYFGGFLLSAVLALSLAGCTPAPIPAPEDSGELVVVTRNSPTTYYLNAKSEPVGFEHDLVTQFAEKQGWKVRFVLAETLSDLFNVMKKGQAHIAAAGLSATDERRRSLRFGPTYGQVKEWVVCRQANRLPQTPAELAGLRLEVVAQSSHVESLRLLKRRLPGLTWAEMNVPNSEELLERVELGLSDCAIADSDSFDIARNFHPTLIRTFALGNSLPQAWLIGPRMGLGFSREVMRFFQESEKSGDLARLRERYFGHVQQLEEADVLGVLEKRGTLLRSLAPHFYKAQGETDMDWRLLAAVAYQESQWNAQAVSFTGVRGIMMLTEDTADQLGVKNRLDPRESILGGARYIISLMAALPEEIVDTDRIWMALAAYNLGMGHVQDARALALKLGRDPNAWNDLKDVLPLLSRGKYASKLKYGYARGGEARAFVENVRIYYDILAKYEKPYRGFFGGL
ncbi:MAG: membrane-bound lytic murein transglycosylase MltF [Gallionellaceae bacterium]|nr:membrane-bound lytic murein transglycosylase MltF [Gallionellaceae bacterium]